MWMVGRTGAMKGIHNTELDIIEYGSNLCRFVALPAIH